MNPAEQISVQNILASVRDVFGHDPQSKRRDRECIRPKWAAIRIMSSAGMSNGEIARAMGFHLTTVIHALKNFDRLLQSDILFREGMNRLYGFPHLDAFARWTEDDSEAEEDVARFGRAKLPNRLVEGKIFPMNNPWFANGLVMGGGQSFVVAAILVAGIDLINNPTHTIPWWVIVSMLIIGGTFWRMGAIALKRLKDEAAK